MKLPLPALNKIAVFRALQLGDLLCSIPAIKSLRCAYPDAEIVLLGLPWSKILVERFPEYFNRFIHFPGYPGLPEQEYNIEKFEAFKQQTKDESFDLIIQMQGNGTVVNEMLQNMNVKYNAGFSPDHTSNPLFLQYPSQIHEVQRHLKLMEHLGITPQTEHLEFPLDKKDELDLDKLQLNLELQKCVCIHPGSRGEWRQWPPEYFAALADLFADKDFSIVITGTENEKNITQKVINNMHHKAIDLTGKTSLGALGVLLKNAFLLISNCTGASHIASALDTPSLIISMDGEPFRWAPTNKEISITIDWTKNNDFDSVVKQAQKLYTAINDKHIITKSIQL